MTASFRAPGAALAAALAVACLTAVVLIATAALPQPAAASRTQESIFQDDRALLTASPAEREAALDEIAALGADAIRTIVPWRSLAPEPDSLHMPTGFDERDPGAYPAAAWERLDALVAGAAARGLDLIVSPAGPIPAWASRCPGPPAARRTCRPSPVRYGRFVEALAHRYAGDWRPAGTEHPMPRVSRWSIWNEPNQGGWLTPQYVVRDGRTQPVAPVLYRELARAALAALRDTGHGGDDVMLGETAPIGRTGGDPAKRNMAPVEFWRGLLCLDSRGRPLGGSASATLACGRFEPLAVAAAAHHPYARGGGAPPTAPSGPGEITTASAGRLELILDQAAALGRLPRRLPVAYTEFGLQSNPPDPYFGVSLRDQAAWINQADWLAFRNPRIRSVAQYELRDEPDLAAFQSGLRFVDGRFKPSYVAYRLPLWVSRDRSGTVLVYGQVRPARGGALERVLIENRAPGARAFRRVATAWTTNAKGFVLVRLRARPGQWRLSWMPADGEPVVRSRVAEAPR